MRRRDFIFATGLAVSAFIKTANALGIATPPPILVRADEVIK
jgi:hypothetical protein